MEKIWLCFDNRIAKHINRKKGVGKTDVTQEELKTRIY